MDDIYSKKVIDRYENPGHVGKLDEKLQNVGTAIVGAPACGDMIKLQIEVDINTGVILDSKFKAFGCCAAIASSSLITEMIQGKTIEEAGAIKNSDVAGELSLPPIKVHCSVLAEEAVRKAIEDYKNKNKEK